MRVFGSAGAYTKVWHLQTLWPLPGSGRRLARLWAGFAVGPPCCLRLGLQAKAQTTNHVCVFDSSEPWPSCHTCGACCAHAVLHPCCALLCVPLAICEHLAARLKASPRRLPLAAPAAERPPSVAWRNSHPRFTLLRLPMSRHGEIASKVGGPGGSLRYVGGRGDLCALFDCCLTTIINILLYDNVGKHDNQIMLTIL